MKPAGIAAFVLAMLVCALPASVGADETPLEHQVRAYLEPHHRYQQFFGLPDDAPLGRVYCGTAGRNDDLACVLTDKRSLPRDACRRRSLLLLRL